MGRFTSKFLINWLTKEKDPSRFPLCDFERICYEVRPCDVLLIEGRSRVSDVIKLITQSSWSHSALYLGRLHDLEDPVLREKAKQFCPDEYLDSQLVVEGVLGKGTVLTPIQEYCQDHIRICRPRGLSPRDSQSVLSYALNRLGTDYDVRQIFDLARLLFPWTIMPRHFRSKLFRHHPGATTKTVCSTVIAEAFNSVDFPILPHIQQDEQKGIELIYRNPKLYTPKDFDYSPYFEIIKYPFVSFDDYYRKLPWNKDGLISNDGVGISKAPETAKIKSNPMISQGQAPLYDTDQEVSFVNERVSPVSTKEESSPEIEATASTQSEEHQEQENTSQDDQTPLPEYGSEEKPSLLKRIKSKRRRKTTKAVGEVETSSPQVTATPDATSKDRV